MSDIVVYTTGCPKCKVLESKMKAKGIEYDPIDDVDNIRSKGFLHVPVMEVNGESYDFAAAVKLVNGFDGNGDFSSFASEQVM